MTSQAHDVISEARRHSFKGQHAESLNLLRSRLDQDGSSDYKAELASEITEVLISQGFFTQAYLAARAALAEVSPESELFGLLTVQEAFMEVMAFGSYGDSVDHVERVYDVFLRRLKPQDYTPTLVRQTRFRYHC
jgi:hypothetical protein